MAETERSVQTHDLDARVPACGTILKAVEPSGGGA